MHSPSTKQLVAPSPWLVSPWFDLALVANLGWVLLLVPGVLASGGVSHLEFWQVYFLIVPHRWITLGLVAIDADRRTGRNAAFLSIAVITALVIVGARATTGAFTCLALVDYVWNYWHFGAQHGGIFRMYSRKAGGGRPKLENWTLRVLVVYTALRLAGWTTGWLETQSELLDYLPWIDLAVAAVPAALLVSEAASGLSERRAKITYLASVTALYGGILLALNAQAKMMVLALTAGAAFFHATEYLAIVTHYAWRRQREGSIGLFRQMAGRWSLVLGVFLAGWGMCAYLADSSPRVHEAWIGLNLWASALHYAFDGMIWKLRRPQTARALGVEIPAEVRA